MLKIITIVLVLAFGFCTVQAQKKNYKPVYGLGIQMGGSSSTVQFDPSIKQKGIYGFTGGMVFNYMGEPHAGVQLELNYTQRGWKEVSDTFGTYTRTLNYVEFPMLSHFTIGNKLVQVIIDFGPYLAYQFSYSEKHTPSDEGRARDHYGQETDKFFDYGFMGGLGISFRTEAGVFQLRGRYTQGLNNLFKKPDEGVFRFSQNQSITIGLVYHIEMSKKRK